MKRDSKTRFETIDKNSLTAPNQSMSIKEIVRRHVNGEIQPLSRPTYYDGLNDFDATDPTLDPNFDLADFSELQEQTRENIENRKKAQIEAHKKAKSNEANKSENKSEKSEKGTSHSEEPKKAKESTSKDDTEA